MSQGWDDPRLPTLSGVRRRGFQPLALKTFCSRIGVSKTDSNIDFAELENVARETMDKTGESGEGIIENGSVRIQLTAQLHTHRSSTRLCGDVPA